MYVCVCVCVFGFGLLRGVQIHPFHARLVEGVAFFQTALGSGLQRSTPTIW